jgi:hypothetical protein
MAKVGTQAIYLGSLMCAAAIYIPLYKRRLITAAEVEEVLAMFSKMLDAVETSEAKFLLPETPAGAREVLQTFLTIINPDVGSDDRPAGKKPPAWLREVIDGGAGS